MYSAGGGAHCASAGVPIRQTAASAPAADAMMSPFDNELLVVFMAPSLGGGCVLVIESLVQIGGQLGALVGRQHRGDGLVEAREPRCSVPRDVPGRGGRRRTECL